jgi:hypothetical protein
MLLVLSLLTTLATNLALANPVADIFPSFQAEAKNQSYSLSARAENLDIGKLTHQDYSSGIAYGAKIIKLVKIPYPRIKAYLDKPGSLLSIVKAVKTQTNVEKISEAVREVSVKLEIKVPVIANFRTQDKVTARETADGRGVLEWIQIGTDGDLTYNQGLVIAEPDGNKTKIFVVGIYIIKPERKVPWIGRATAAKFAHDHYSNYISALEDLIPPQ